jgi:hypothetical protein
LPRSDFYRVAVVEGRGWEMQSFVALARAIVPPDLSFIVTPLTVLVGAVSLLALVWAAHRRRDDERFLHLYGLAILTIPFVSPHLFLYDCLVLVIPVLVLISSGRATATVRWSLILAFPLMWTTPFRHFAVETESWPLTLMSAPWAIVPMAMLFHTLRGLAIHSERQKGSAEGIPVQAASDRAAA